MIKKLSALLLLFSFAAHAGLPPTTIQGQSDTTAAPKFSFQVPRSQFTDLGGVKALIETGNKNYLKDPRFESGTVAGWTAVGCATITNGIPACNGSGGAAFSAANGGRTKNANTTAPAVVSTGQIEGKYSLKFATSAATTVGDMYVSPTFTIDPEDQGKVLSVKFSYSVSSGASNGDFSGTSSNTFAIALYDQVNNTWINPAGAFGITQSSGAGSVSATFQTAINTAGLQLAVYNPTASGGAISLLLDSFYTGPQVITQGTPVTDWQSYTPTLGQSTGITNNVAEWRRVGDTVYVRGTYYQNSAGSSSAQSIGLPNSWVLDTNKMPSTSATHYGTFLWVDSSSNNNIGFFGLSGTTLQMQVQGGFGPLWPSNCKTGTYVQYEFSVPVTGWSSQVQMSSDSDTRVVAARAYATTSHNTVADNAETVIPLDAVDYDTHGGISGLGTSSFQYKVTSSGYYRVSAQTLIHMPAAGTAIGNTQYLHVQKNGVVAGTLGTYTAYLNGQNLDYPLNGSTTIKCTAGDTLTVSVLVIYSNTGTGTFDGTVGSAVFEKVSGPSQIAASETVTAKSSSAPSGSISSSIGSSGSVVFSSMQYDSHGAYNTSTGAYVCNQSETLNVSGQLTTQGTFSINNFADVGLFKNGVQDKLARTYSGGSMSTVTTPFVFDIKCLAGDSLTLRGQSNATSPSWVNDAAISWVQFKKIGNY